MRENKTRFLSKWHYTIRWLNYNGDALETDENVAEGTTPTYNGDTPTKAEDSSCTYTFDKWTPDIVAASNDATYTATFTCTAKQSSSSSSPSSSGGGGGGKTIKKDTTIAETDKDTEKEDADNKEDNKNDNTPTYEQGDQSEVLDNGYTREFNNAYRFGLKYGITTMDDINKADMYGPLTRIAMAKMLSNYAMNVLDKKPSNVVVPNFPDVSSELNQQYGGAVTLAYQLGIMGLNIENFRPYDEVTRAEFATALSRILYGLPDGSDAYYTTHLSKLKAEGIISNDDPKLKELRGYVMIMLMRSAM